MASVKHIMQYNSVEKVKGNNKVILYQHSLFGLYLNYQKLMNTGKSNTPLFNYIHVFSDIPWYHLLSLHKFEKFRVIHFFFSLSLFPLGWPLLSLSLEFHFRCSTNLLLAFMFVFTYISMFVYKLSCFVV